MVTTLLYVIHTRSNDKRHMKVKTYFIIEYWIRFGFRSDRCIVQVYVFVLWDTFLTLFSPQNSLCIGNSFSDRYIVQVYAFVLWDRNKFWSIIIVGHSPNLIYMIVKSMHTLFSCPIPNLDSVVSWAGCEMLIIRGKIYRQYPTFVSR